MAGSSYSYDKSNPFFSTIDEDVDDATFLKGSRAYQQPLSAQEQRQKLMDERKRIEERTIQSTRVSMGLLQQSEEIGNATAQELTRQREQLESTEQKLDDINSSLRTSQKHIQGIKSVFGSIKNYFAGSKGDIKPSPLAIGDEINKLPRAKSDLSQVLESHNSIERKVDVTDHPSLRIRAEPTPVSSRDVDQILDQNLEDMGASLSRLKGLGLGLQQELEDQNLLVERITRKTEDVDFRIEHQNKEMHRILKK